MTDRAAIATWVQHGGRARPWQIVGPRHARSQAVAARGSGPAEDGGYVLKVLAEQQRLKDIASGKHVSILSNKLPAEDGLIELLDKARSLSPFNLADDKP